MNKYNTLIKFFDIVECLNLLNPGNSCEKFKNCYNIYMFDKDGNEYPAFEIVLEDDKLFITDYYLVPLYETNNYE